MPQALSWLVGYEAHPYFADCGALVLNCTTVQDAGMRFGTRAVCVALETGKAKVVGEVRGQWLLEEQDAPSPFVIEGDRLTLKSLDRPRAFYVNSSDKVFERTEVYSVSPQGLRRTAVNISMPYLRAADAWMAAAMNARPGTKAQRAFVKTYGRQPLEAREWAEQADADGGTAVLSSAAGRYTFAFIRTGKAIEFRGIKFEKGK